ncbi:MAG: NUDIX domain-containing protein [Parcubacteria group bacterium]|nr:NUDIX domain-containing protein [Parcubacteria group bacterium]
MTRESAESVPEYVVVTTTVVLRRDSDGVLESLVFRRRDEDAEGPGLWTIAGGKMSRKDWGRQRKTKSHPIWEGGLRRAAAREIKEEGGFDVPPDTLRLLEDGDVIFIRKSGTPTLVLTYWTLLAAESTVQLGREMTDYAWLKEKDLGKYAFIGDVADHVRRAMSACDEELRVNSEKAEAHMARAR